MGTKENFNQAMHEVFPFYKNAKASGAEAEFSEEVAVSSYEKSRSLDFQTAYNVKQMQNIEIVIKVKRQKRKIVNLIKRKNIEKNIMQKMR